MPGIRVVQPTTGLERDVTIDRVVRANYLFQTRQTAAYGKSWRVVVGRFRDRRSHLLYRSLALRNVERPGEFVRKTARFGFEVVKYQYQV